MNYIHARRFKRSKRMLSGKVAFTLLLPWIRRGRGLLPFYAILVQLDTFTVLRQNALTFTQPPPYGWQMCGIDAQPVHDQQGGGRQREPNLIRRHSHGRSDFRDCADGDARIANTSRVWRKSNLFFVLRLACALMQLRRGPWAFDVIVNVLYSTCWCVVNLRERERR